MEENLQIMNLIRGYSPKHIKNSDNSTARKKKNQNNTPPKKNSKYFIKKWAKDLK